MMCPAWMTLHYAVGRRQVAIETAGHPPTIRQPSATSKRPSSTPAVSYQVRRRSLSVLASQSAEVAIKKGRWRISMPATQFMEK
jgi:hypothetical protein